MHTLQKLDLFRYRREGDEIESLLSGNPDSRELSSSFKMSLQAEMELFNTLRSTNDVDSAEKVLREYLNHFVFERPVYTEDSIELLIQPVYCSEALEDSAKTKLILSKLGDLSTFADKGYFENLKNQPYRLRLYVEMYLAKYLEESKVDDSVTSLKKFEMLIDIVLKYIVYADIPPISQYQSLHKSDKSILFIILWRILTLFDKVYQGIERFRRRVQFLLSFCNTRYMRFLDDLKKLLILYSLNQTIIPLLNLKEIPTMDSVCANFFPSMERFIAFFLGDTVTSTLKYQDLPQFGSWKQFVMLNFMLMNHLVAKRTHKVIRFSEGEKLQPPSLDDINTKLYPFNIVNLNDIKKKVKKLAHDVKDHKYLTLFTGFLMDNYDDNQLLKGILEDSVAQPFDDKLIIKTLLCMIFYLEGDYFKSYQLIYQVLEREKLQEKNTYVITYMATLLCLKYLDKPEEALAFAKSNLDYVARGTTNLFPLRREVLYAIAGFTYESIGKNSPLFVERMDNYAKAIDFFEKSYQENPANEEALYHLSVLNATIHNFDAAYKYIKEATKSRVSNVNVYMLLILVSTAMGDYKKAGLLLEELLPNHKHPLLFVLKAFLEIENILSRQTKTLIGSIDDELKESKQDKLEEPPIEASEIKEVSQEVLSLIKASALSILNSNADDIDLPAVVSLPSKYEHQEVLDYQNLLMLAVEAFIRLKDYPNAENVLELSKLKNVQENEYLYYKGLLCELRKEYDKAKDYYDLLLLKTSNFFKAYLHLGIIHLTFEERRDLVTAKRYLEEALRYEENSEVLYYLGKLHEDQGDNLMASQYILKSLELSYRQPILPFSVLLNEFMPN